MSVSIDQSRRVVEYLAKASLKNTRILDGMHRKLAQSPSSTGGDAIQLIDALGRNVPLPYAYFNQWEVRFLTLEAC